jgi:DegV family protein with EDD domain
MEKRQVAVVTDSGASLPRSLTEQYGIEVLPLWLQIEGEAYRDGVDIQPLEFFSRLRAKVLQLRTSQPSLGEFLDFYRRVQQQAESIVSVHVASRYSGVFNAARAAAAELMPFPIEVVDSGSIGMAQGFVALAAAQAAAAGASLTDVVEKVRVVLPKVDLVAMLESLEYAVRGGRLASAARLVDSLLNIKPLVRVRGNEVGVIGQARTRAKAIGRLLQELASRVGDAPCHVAVMYSETIEEAQRLRDEIVARFRCVEVHLAVVAPVLGVHAGPGAVALAFYADD